MINLLRVVFKVLRHHSQVQFKEVVLLLVIII